MIVKKNNNIRELKEIALTLKDLKKEDREIIKSFTLMLKSDK